MDWQGRTVLLGVTGGVAIYKSVDLASKLTRLGANVDVVMTEAACRFIMPLQFAAVTRRGVHLNLWETERRPGHIALAERPDIIVVAPATANTLAKIAHGIADNLLTSALLAARKPILLAPAMNSGMWEARATRENMETLMRRGCHVVGPGSGRLACGDVGWGRMAEPGEVIAAMNAILEAGGEGRMDVSRKSE